MAASLAIHGMVLLWINAEAQSDAAGHEAIVEISIASARSATPSVTHQTAFASAQTKREKKLRKTADSTRESPVREAAGQKEVVDSLETSAAQADVEQNSREARESRVRNHLEQFKYYPASARRRGINGEVEVAFELDSLGQAKLVKIMSGSGYSLLDEAALETVHSAEPFPVDGGAYQFVLRFRAS